MPSTTSTSHDADRLLELLSQQTALANELEALAQRQGEMIEGRRNESLLELLAQRQRLIDALLAAQDEQQAAMRAIDRERLDETRRMRIESSIAELNQRLESIMALDDRDKAALRRRRDEAQTELTTAGAARQARGAYLAGESGGSAAARFADRRG